MTPWVEILNQDIKWKVGHIRFALIDFDGTISVIRRGWEDVMVSMMIEMICDGNPPTLDIEKEVRDYVDYSTGMLTIKQMEWLSEAVNRHGLSEHPKSPQEYKRIYNKRILNHIDERLRRLTNGDVRPKDLMIMGSKEFIEGLKKHRVVSYLASGTDHEYVLAEANALRITNLFDGGVYGALDHTEAQTKENIIRRILDDNGLGGSDLLVVGDGPVEIRNAKSRGAIAIGVASDEEQRWGWNQRKKRRLTNAGADLLIPDFTKYNDLLDYLFTNP